MRRRAAIAVLALIGGLAPARARAQGYETGEKVANAIGRPIQGLTPREVRDLLRSQL